MSDQNLHKVLCPHCKGAIEIHHNQVMCGIFRHGVFKSNMHPINPHASEEECQRLTKNGLIHGCGQPFQFKNGIVEKCGYI